jgi:hypothetical protein
MRFLVTAVTSREPNLVEKARPGGVRRVSKKLEQDMEKNGAGWAYLTAEECREHARRCLQESNNVRANLGSRAAWLKLAERWFEASNSMALSQGN